MKTGGQQANGDTQLSSGQANLQARTGLIQCSFILYFTASRIYALPHCIRLKKRVALQAKPNPPFSQTRTPDNHAPCIMSLSQITIIFLKGDFRFCLPKAQLHRYHRCSPLPFSLDKPQNDFTRGKESEATTINRDKSEGVSDPTFSSLTPTVCHPSEFNKGPWGFSS